MTAYCHKCRRETETVILPLSGGLGNCCSVCRTCRRGKPYFSKLEAATLKANGQKVNDEEAQISPR